MVDAKLATLGFLVLTNSSIIVLGAFIPDWLVYRTSTQVGTPQGRGDPRQLWMNIAGICRLICALLSILEFFVFAAVYIKIRRDDYTKFSRWLLRFIALLSFVSILLIVFAITSSCSYYGSDYTLGYSALFCVISVVLSAAIVFVAEYVADEY